MWDDGKYELVVPGRPTRARRVSVGRPGTTSAPTCATTCVFIGCPVAAAMAVATATAAVTAATADGWSAKLESII